MTTSILKLTNMENKTCLSITSQQQNQNLGLSKKTNEDVHTKTQTEPPVQARLVTQPIIITKGERHADPN